jgi:hypothetical protein
METKAGELCSQDHDKAIQEGCDGDAPYSRKSVDGRRSILDFFDLSFSGHVWLARDDSELHA